MARGGYRPGSGRKSFVEEGRICDLIRTSVEITERFINDESYPLEKRVEVASRFVAKRIPSDVNIGGQAENPLAVVTLKMANDSRTNESTDKSN